VFEPRHERFFCEDFVQLLRKRNVGLVFADAAGKWPYAEDMTADFVYVRLHGAGELYAGGYTDERLDWWAKRIRKWGAGAEARDARLITKRTGSKNAPRDVYVYFDNSITKSRTT